MAGSPEKLICPQTGELCDFQSYCAGRKEAMDEGVDPVSQVGMLQTRLLVRNPRIGEIMLGNFCSAERVAKFQEMVDVQEGDATDEIVAKSFLEREVVTREHFRTENLPV